MIRTPLIRWLYEDGRSFTAQDTQLASFTLLWFAAGLVGHSLLEVIVRAFYALHDTRTPVGVGVVAMGLNIVFSFAFSSLFQQIGWQPVGGLALANSAATFLEMVVLLFLLQGKLGGIEWRKILAVSAQGLAGALGMAGALWAWFFLGAALPVWLLVLGGAALGGAVYAVILLILRVPETGLIVGQARRLTGRLAGR